MKKIFIILLCMITLNANATEMCARNDTVVIPLDSTINRNSGYNNYVEHLWWITYEYGTLYGSAACLSLKEIQEIQNDSALTTAPTVLNTTSDELVGMSGYYENNTEDTNYARNYCYWKLNHPMSSNWVYAAKYNIPVDNAYSCDANCHHRMVAYDDIDIRTRLFNSIGTLPPWSED